MTPEQQRIAIADVCGWKEAFPKSGSPHPETKFGGILLPYLWVNEITHRREMDLPDYVNDLNAMHEAENVLREHDQARYQDVMAFMFIGPSEHYPLFQVIHATAAQRAEAFLRTIGKWEESPVLTEPKEGV